jgi:hypothetical protein
LQTKINKAKQQTIGDGAFSVSVESVIINHTAKLNSTCQY